MPDLMNIASTGIAASQSAINVTGQNIANVSSTGYSREKVNQSTATSGQGTQVVNISRIYNQFLANQANNAVTTSSASNAQYAQVQPLNAILTDPNAGISPAMTEFFNALQGVSTQAADIGPRQAAIGSGQNLVSAMKTVQTTIDSINSDINTQLAQSVASVNDYASQIVALNKAILGTTDSSTLNGLEDQRDIVVSQLSKEVKVSVTTQNNQYIVSIANGVPLLDTSKTFPLSTMASALIPSQTDVMVSGINGSTFSSQNMAGGKIGGLIDFRENVLNPASNNIGLIALGLTTQINNAQATGSSLQATQPVGQTTPIPQGPPLFTVGNILVRGSTTNNPLNPNNAVSANFNVDPLNKNAFLKNVTTSDYTLKFDGTNYSLTRDSDGAVFSTSSNTPPTFNQDGMSITINSALTNGDTYRISPTANAASNFDMVTTDPLAIAAAAGGAATPANVSAGDNTNMTNLLQVPDNQNINGGASSLVTAFSQFISTIGNQSHQLQVKSTFDDSVALKTTQALQNTNGVNLDEEAANLIRFQQAYQASGKVMQIAKQMFDSLISSIQ
jgi:flagellar hook-associated protein 1 FlgK